MLVVEMGTIPGWKPLPKRNEFMERLLQQSSYAEVILTGWGIAETLMDDVILKEYRLSGHDVRADPLLELDFEDKLQLQLKSGMLSKEEFRVVKKFQERRNRLFHKEGLFFHNVGLFEKEDLAEIAIKAVQVIEALEARSNSAEFKEMNWLDLAKAKTSLKP